MESNINTPSESPQELSKVETTPNKAELSPENISNFETTVIPEHSEATTKAKPKNPKPSPRQNLLLKILLFTIPLAGLGIWVWQSTPISPPETILVGMVEAREVVVAAKITGRVDSLWVEEGDWVKEGQTVGQLLSPEVDAKIGQATGQAQAAKERLSLIEQGPRSQELAMVQTAFRQAQEQRLLAESTWVRMASLYQDSALSRQQADEARFRWRTAQENEKAAQERLKMLQIGSRPQEIAAAKAQLMSAEQALQEVNLWKNEAALKAPQNGRISKRYLSSGEIASAGSPIFILVDPSKTWVSLNAREDQLSALPLGTQIKGYLPAFADTITFEVYWISAQGDYATWRSTARRGDADLRGFEVRLRPIQKPQNPSLEWIPGMSVHLRLPQQPAKSQS
jgi:HlyD family secretion protein